MLAFNARCDGKSVSFAGGGSDLLGMLKERIVNPDVLIHLSGITGLDQVESKHGTGRIGRQVPPESHSRHPVISSRNAVLAEAAASVATPQIRNAGTLAG